MVERRLGLAYAQQLILDARAAQTRDGLGPDTHQVKTWG